MSPPTVDQASKQNFVVNIQDSDFGKLVVQWRERDIRLYLLQQGMDSCKHWCTYQTLCEPGSKIRKQSNVLDCWTHIHKNVEYKFLKI